MFVALDLPDESRAGLARWRDALVRGRRDLRPVPEDHLHVTLAFLGWQDESAADSIAASAGAAVDGLRRPRLTPTEVRGVPERRPRLFALDLLDEGGHAGALQAAVAAALERDRLYEPERRAFWPHVTLARAKRGERRVDTLPAGRPPLPAFEPTELTLYRSTLRPQGALYEPLGRTTLAA
ncbi:MAG: RNA 2',3'-cyclic phosphodiesterase [Thermoleophilaceae bacterium]|nr:RNA 2',3'-cyclic phosphodiesterase [Thermoleophilaceae bacterium]